MYPMRLQYRISHPLKNVENLALEILDAATRMIHSHGVIGVTRQMLDFERAERRNKGLKICVNVLCRSRGPKPSTLKTEEQGAVDNRIACFLF
jgi:hypothetical protein